MSGKTSIKMKSNNIKKSNNKNIKSNQENLMNNSNKYDPENDTSVLTKPFATSVSGFSGVLKVFNNATTEVKDYLSNECDILYECRVCKNIFRSISNFITHKRSYCLDKYNCVIHLKCSNKHESDYVNIKESQEQINKNKENGEEITKRTTRKSLQTLVESLAQKKQFGIERKDFSISEFYKERNPDVFNDDLHKDDIKINLEHINGSNSVYQTIKNEEDCNDQSEEIKLEVKEIHDMLEGQSVVLGPDGRILDFNSGNTVRLGITSGDNPENRVCGICQMKFATRKTYVSHMKYKHANSRLVYPCPECSDILATSWSVYRHLFNVHHKTLAQVKKMRNNIQAKAYYQVQQALNKKQISSPTKTSGETIDDKNEEWIDNFETDNDMQMCGGCGKRFERRAALNSHSQTCQKRIAAKNTIVVNRLKRTAVEEKMAEIQKNPPKIPKFDHSDLNNAIGIDRRKTNIMRKRKIGIQIRYDYTKPSDKSLTNSMIREDIRTIKTYDLTNTKDDDIIDTNSANISDEICAIVGVPPRKFKQHLQMAEKDPLEDTEILSIHSSNNSTPIKEEPNTQDTSDSEIEEIFTSPETDDKNELRNNKDKLDDNTIKIIKLFNNAKPSCTGQNKISLDKIMTEYVDTKKMECIPCNVNFGNISKLRSHMSEHFNWRKYRCDICSYKSYEKIAIIDHIDKVHNVDDPMKIEASIFQIPEFETIKMASEKFIPLLQNEENNKEKYNEHTAQTSTQDSEEPTEESKNEDTQKTHTRGRGRPPKKRKTVSEKNNDNEDTKEFEDVKPELLKKEKGDNNSNLQDIALRKMVLEVIFGQNNESASIETESIISNNSDSDSKYSHSPETPEKNLTNAPRPVRNRIKPINKDFIYDLNEFTDMPTRSLSQNSNKSQHNSPEKNLSKSLEDLSAMNNKNKNKSGKKPASRSNSNLDLRNDNNLSDLNLQNKNNEDCSSNSSTIIKNLANTFEIKSKVVDIQKDNEVWIIDDE